MITAIVMNSRFFILIRLYVYALAKIQKKQLARLYAIVKFNKGSNEKKAGFYFFEQTSSCNDSRKVIGMNSSGKRDLIDVHV
jgi:hypothetical protein